MDPKANKPGSSQQAKKGQNLPSPQNKASQHVTGTKPKEESFDKNFLAITENLLSLQLDDPEFDDITVREQGQPKRREDNLLLLNLKLNKLVEILQREEDEMKLLEEKSKELKESIDEKLKSTEASVEATRQQLQDQLEKHGQLVQEKEVGLSQSQNIAKELQAKEEAILELNKNIQQLMSEFIAARDRNDRVEEKLMRIKDAKKAEEEDLKGPRPGSQEYEEKMNRIWALERTLKEEEETRRALEEENEHLKQQLKELAPHSVLNPEDKSPPRPSSLVDLEKYADMKPEDIHQDIESLKAQANKQQELINQLEAQNKADIDAINIQKAKIEELRGVYAKYIERFNKAKREKEEALERYNHIEEQISEMKKRFNNISIILGKDISPGEVAKGSEEGSGHKVKSPTFMSPGQSFGGKAETFVPAPSKLNVVPSKGEKRDSAHI